MRNKRLFLSVILTIITVCFASALRAQEKAQEQQASPRQARKMMVGGPCTYKAIKGACKIVSVEQTEGSKKQASMAGGPGYEGYEIKFIFVPEKPADFSDVAWAKDSENAILSTQYPLLLTNSWYPSYNFLRKYKIKKDAFFPCEMDLITSGTCSPITFKFSGINTQDYSQ
jgi:hypothetical protein